MHLFRMKSLLAGAAVACVLVAGAAPRANAQGAKKKVLVITFCKGFKHGSIPLGEKVLQQLGDKTGEWTCDYARTEEEVKAKTTPEALKGLDAVCCENNTGLPPVADRDEFIKWVKDGHTFLGMHAGSDLMGQGEQWPEYLEMLGGQFRTHNQQTPITVNINDFKHPANAVFGKEATWTTPQEEIYLLRNMNLAEMHLLLSMTSYPMDKSATAGKPGLIPVSWCRNYGKGRVFFTILGHNDGVWNLDTFQAHLTGGIEWALGLKGQECNVTPQAKTGLWVVE